MPHGLAVPFHLVLAALGEREREPRRPRLPAPDPHDVEGARRAIVEDEAPAPAREIVRADVALDERLVHPRDAVPRVQQAVRERAIVGQEQRSFDVGVEPSDRIEPDAVGDEIGDDGPSLGVAHGRDVAARLVQEQIAERFGAGQRPAVDSDEIGPGIGERRQVPDDRAVDGDAAFGDELLSAPS